MTETSTLCSQDVAGAVGHVRKPLPKLSVNQRYRCTGRWSAWAWCFSRKKSPLTKAPERRMQRSFA